MIYRVLSPPPPLPRQQSKPPIIIKSEWKKHTKNKSNEKMPANLPDTFQLTDKMNFRKYDFWCSRIFHVPPIFRAKHFHQMQKIRKNYEHAFINCKGIIQYLYEFRPRLWFDLPWPLDDILTKSRSSGLTSWPASSMNSINCGMC